MNAASDWSDLALFSAVARHGNLGAAAAETGSSAATLSRRMTRLERGIGKRLFLHGKGGYAVTGDGRDLLERVKRMEAAAVDIESWRRAGTAPVRVRISAGTWTAHLLAENLGSYWDAGSDWVPEFVQCNRDMDIARREVDIGLRNRRPEQPWLAGRRIGTTLYAVYAASDSVEGWIGGSPETSPLPSERWVAEHHGDGIVTTANEPQLRLALAEAGLGRTVLPTFIGDARPGLVRLSDAIDALKSDQWLVAHHEARFEPGIRAALDAIAGFWSEQARPAA